MKNLSLIALLFLVLFSACKKDELIINTPTNITSSPIDDWNPVVENVNGKLVGQVHDEFGAPIKEATVLLNNETTTTNEYGFFFFENTSMNSNGSYVKVKKAGYFLGSRRFFPQADVRSNVKITLLKKSFSQSFSSDSESLMEFEGASVKFPANSIAQANGEIYDGNVNFAAKWLDPSSPEVFAQMPGNLQGVNTESDEVVLQTLGMIAVELEDEAGNELNILEGNTATISVSVPEELRANAPDEIPLWSFDEEHGMWVEEGMASLENGVYVGEVAHFSFWNCDIPMEYINFEATILIDNGFPFVDGLVSLHSENLGTGAAVPNEYGVVSGKIPANQVLILKVFDPWCPNIPLFEQTIGPFSEDTNLEILTLEATNILTTIQGSLINCDNNPVSNGMIEINYPGGVYYSAVTDSDFSFSHLTCTNPPSSMSITGIDLENNVAGTPVEVNVEADNYVGLLSTCGADNTPDFLNLTVAGLTKDYFVTGVMKFEDDSIRFEVNGPGSTGIQISFSGVTTGSYESPDNLIYVYDAQQDWYFGNYTHIQNQGTTEIVVQEAEGKLSGTINGEFMLSGVLEDVDGEFLITLPD